MSLIAIVPARGGSKGIPRKNIAPLGGRPLIEWTIDAAIASQAFDRVIVSTDDAEIAQVSRNAGAEAPFFRPPEIASDSAPALPVIVHVLDELRHRDDLQPDGIVYLQPTSPFRGATALARCASDWRKSDADTVVSVCKVPHNMVPSSLMRPDGHGRLQFLAPPGERLFQRQRKEQLYARNGPAILGMKTAVARGGSLYGNSILPFEMSAIESIDIDEPIDLEVAEALLPLALRDGFVSRAGQK